MTQLFAVDDDFFGRGKFVFTEELIAEKEIQSRYELLKASSPVDISELQKDEEHLSGRPTYKTSFRHRLNSPMKEIEFQVVPLRPSE